MESAKPIYSSAVFVPEDRETGSVQRISSARLTCYVAHNEIIAHNQPDFDGHKSTPSPTAFLIAGIAHKSVVNLFAHTAAISQDPIRFVESKKYSITQKAIDLTLTGPLTAIVDVITSIGIVIFSTAVGIWALIKAKKTENMLEQKERKEQSEGFFVAAKWHAAGIITSALRIVPIVGAFLSYGAQVVTKAAQIKTPHKIGH